MLTVIVVGAPQVSGRTIAKQAAGNHAPCWIGSTAVDPPVTPSMVPNNDLASVVLP